MPRGAPLIEWRRRARAMRSGMLCATPMSAISACPRIWRRRSAGSIALRPVPAELVDLTHDRIERAAPTRIERRVAARRQLALGEQRLERDAAARDAALDRTDRDAADLRGFLIGEPARAD